MKRFVSICLSLLFVCVLTACSGSQRESGSQDLQEQVPTGMENPSSGVGHEETEVRSDSETNIAGFHLEAPTPGTEQVIYLWDEGKMPAPRTYSIKNILMIWSRPLRKTVCPRNVWQNIIFIR